MKLGLFTSCLHDRDLAGVLEVTNELGLASVELSSGGYFPAPHLHMDALQVSEHARLGLLEQLRDGSAALTALNSNGNPLHPNEAIRDKHAADVHRSIDVASDLGVGVVIVQSGSPGAEPTSTLPSWVVSPWDSAYIDALDYQWCKAVPFWTEAAKHAEDKGVKLAVEMHPHQLVYNPPTLERLITEVGSDAIGMEMDPSHLFWQGIDPIEVIEWFGERVFVSAAKDTRINTEHLRRNGFLNNLWQRDGYTPSVSLGGPFLLNAPPKDPSYQFVAIGRGHDTDFWAGWLAALHKVNPDIAVNIEHEDEELGRIEGLEFATASLREAAEKAGVELQGTTPVTA